MSNPSQAWRGAPGGLPGAGPPLPALGKLASRQILLRAALGEPRARHPWVPGAPRARGSVGLWRCGPAGLPPTQAVWFGSDTRCTASAPDTSVVQSGSCGSELGVLGRAGWVPRGFVRCWGSGGSPKLSPPLLGWVARSAAFVNRACGLQRGSAASLPPRNPYVMFSQCSLFKGCPGIPFPLAALSLTWFQLPTMGWVLCKPQRAAVVNVVVRGVTQVGG